MPSIRSLLEALDERTIARRVGIPHDEARVRFALRSNTAANFDQFAEVIGEYYRHHFAACVAQGGSLSRTEATSRAKGILEREYRRVGGDLMTAFNDAHDGTNGGLRALLDKLAESLKTESVEHYTREMFRCV